MRWPYCAGQYVIREEHDSGQLHIVVCPQMFKQLPKHYIAFQMEQSVNSRWFTEEYFARLNNAVAIFDYSLKISNTFCSREFPIRSCSICDLQLRGLSAYLTQIGYDLSDRKGDKAADVFILRRS
ncbi:Uncharacterised protein [Raoultella terrigena]|uniref:Uncharacterized protein n=1 Tax=Raoultella terrigena TaxID=577 RepID=A0A4U9D3P2_RAOTE|nr:Uncharacterised protein [Raoultella terrigena]